MALSSGAVPSSGCNLDVLVLFDNVCTSTNLMGACEQALIQSGDYIIGDQLVNPGFNASASSSIPDSAANTDNDIGLVRLSSSTLVNGRPEPGVLLFNRSDLGAQCTDLGELTSVGYGITEPSQGSSALSGLKYTVTHDAKVKDAWHIEADGAQPDPLQTCGVGSGEEPTCEGDSGGPSFDSTGVIMGVTSLGDETCSAISVSTRIDAYAPWIDTTMASWGDPKNGTIAPADGGSTTDAGPPSGDEASTSNADASASTGEGGAPTEAEGGTDVTVQASASGGCSVGVAVPGGRRTGALAPLLMMVTAVARRRRRTARASL
jgi:MYXO-CTERM domain-containing protein